MGSQRVRHDRVTLTLPFTWGIDRFTPGVRSRVRGAGSPLTVQTCQAVVWQPSGWWGRLLGWGASRAGSRQTQGSTGAAAVRTVCPCEQPPRASPPVPRDHGVLPHLCPPPLHPCPLKAQSPVNLECRRPPGNMVHARYVDRFTHPPFSPNHSEPRR